MIRVNNLEKSFKDLKVITDLSISILESKITVLAGADGAGKSTLIKILLGLVKKDRGVIYLNNKDIKSDFSKITNISGYMPERFSLYPDLSVEENLNFFAQIHSVEKKQKEELKNRLLEQMGMLEFSKRRACALSGGMKQKLALSAILLSSPDIIFLDEPTTGVDPLSRIEFFKIIKELKMEGKTILLSTSYLDEAENGDFIIFLKRGRVLLQDYISKIKDNFSLQLYRLLPEGNLFHAVNRIKEIEGKKENIYIRGKYIKYLKTENEDLPKSVKFLEIKREKANLEDIYIYYERKHDE